MLKTQVLYSSLPTSKPLELKNDFLHLWPCSKFNFKNSNSCVSMLNWLICCFWEKISLFKTEIWLFKSLISLVKFSFSSINFELVSSIILSSSSKIFNFDSSSSSLLSSVGTVSGSTWGISIWVIVSAKTYFNWVKSL